MTEIDSDPTSQRAQNYYKSLEEQARKQKNRRPAQILIKTMNRGRSKTQKLEVDDNGNPLMGADLLMRKKKIEFASVAFPQVNPFPFSRPSKN